VLARVRSRLTYANVIATMALFVALGGSSYAALTITGKNVRNGTLTGKDFKRNSLTGKQIREGRLGTNSLTGRQIRESSLARVPLATSATNATNATNAVDADTLDGRAPGTFASATPEAVHVVGATGEPAFGTGWSEGTFRAPGFWKDQAGVVHLQGSVDKVGGANGEAIFTLPAGYRPSIDTNFVTSGAVGTFHTPKVVANGNVQYYAGTGTSGFVSLEGITFRADG
jgi:hypothetical protein